MVTFRKPIGSVSVSGHKFVGAPVPCGVVITRKRYAMALSSDVEYLNSRDATIMVRSVAQRRDCSVCHLPFSTSYLSKSLSIASAIIAKSCEIAAQL